MVLYVRGVQRLKKFLKNNSFSDGNILRSVRINDDPDMLNLLLRSI